MSQPATEEDRILGDVMDLIDTITSKVEYLIRENKELKIQLRDAWKYDGGYPSDHIMSETYRCQCKRCNP